MGWLEGVLTGYAGRHYDILKEKREEAEKAAQREGKVFETLLNSPYKDVKDYALAGMLDLGNPRRRKGGVSGWMGEIEQTPYLAMIQRARERIGSDPEYARGQLPPDEDQELGGTAPATPSIPATGGSVAPTGSAAQPSTSLVTGGPATPPTPPPAPPTASFMPGADATARAGQTTDRPSASFMPGVPATAGDPRFDQPNVSFAPPAPPTAGPPLPVSAGPPPPPGQVGGGLPGATTRPVGQPPPVRSARTQFPSVVPTVDEAVMSASRARSAGTDLGEQDSYIRVALAQGLTRADGLKMWADAQLSARGGSALQNAPMEFEITGADGRPQRVLGWADRRSQQYVDLNGRPFPPGTNVIKAAPYSSFTGDTWSRMALNKLGIHPAQLVGNPDLAAQVEAEADNMAGGRAARLTNERGFAAADNPLSGSQRVNQMTKWQAQYNAYKAPLRLMELYLRNMSASYAELKQNPSRAVAWEPFRTAFVHVNEAGSVVMPSEFSRAGAIGSLVERVQGQIDQWMKGGGPLPDTLVDDMMHVAAAQWDAVQGYDQNFRSQVEEQLKDPALQGIRPEQIFGAPTTRFDPWTIATPQAAAPPPPPPPAGPAGPGAPPATNPTTNPPVRPNGGTGVYWDAAQQRYVTPGP